MSTLPHPNSRPLFDCQDNTGATVKLRGRQPYAREIDDYVFNASKWPARCNTVDKILRADPKKCRFRCEACDELAKHCSGQECINHFHSVIAPAGKDLVEIRPAGIFGWGLFAKRAISYGTIIGEYLGELIRNVQAVDPTDLYAFEIDGLAACSARRFGNVTRFVNHHCNPNLIVEPGMYGKRLVMLFKANTDIAAGDQVFISYGRHYFVGLGIQCKCDKQPGDHLPPRNAGEEDVERVAKKATGKKTTTKKATGKKTTAKKATGKKTTAKKATAKKTAAKKAAEKKAAKKTAAGEIAAGKKARANEAATKAVVRKLTRAAGVKKR